MLNSNTIRCNFTEQLLSLIVELVPALLRVPAFLLVLVRDWLRVFPYRWHYCSGSNISLVTRMVWRGVLVRALEWRARWFADPADRLHFLRRNVAERSVRLAKSRRRETRTFRRASIMVITLLAALADTDTTAMLPPGKQTPVRAASVWLVQTTPQFDLYSNGLRIEEQYATFTEPRRYLAFARTRAGPIASAGRMAHRTGRHRLSHHREPLAPFEESQNRSLRRAGRGCSNT